MLYFGELNKKNTSRSLRVDRESVKGFLYKVLLPKKYNIPVRRTTLPSLFFLSFPVGMLHLQRISTIPNSSHRFSVAVAYNLWVFLSVRQRKETRIKRKGSSVLRALFIKQGRRGKMWRKVGKYRCRRRLYTQSSFFMMHLTSWSPSASRMYTSEATRAPFCSACEDVKMTDVRRRYAMVTRTNSS